MEKETNKGISDGLAFPTLRDIVSILFRRLKVIVIGFVAVFLLTFSFLMSQPRFAAEMSVLVSKKRVDPVVTSNSTTADSGNRAEITEEDLNTEAELLKSPDLLRDVVLKLNLQNFVHPSILHRDNSEEARIQRAVNSFSSNLQVKLIPKTYLLSISYRNSSQTMAALILRILGDEYRKKNVALSEPTGERAFFEEQANEYEQRMRDAGQAAVDFAHKNNIVDADAESGMAVHRADEFHASAITAGVSISETEHQIAALQKAQQTTPVRVATGEKRSDNPELLQIMKSSMLNLQTKEADMSSKFQPSYPPLIDLRQQMKLTQNAIDDQLKRPLSENSTDRNPLRDWIDNQLEQARSSLAALQARKRSDEQAYTTYKQNADKLLQESIEQHVLNSDAKAETDNYLVYARRKEEARISEELNNQGILNVVIASPAKASIIPVLPRSQIVLIAALLGAFIGCGLGFFSEYFDDKIRTPQQLEDEVGSQVLAAVPASS
jgi:uncharacterized protein involved in exopolysaccharide biosynthesis